MTDRFALAAHRHIKGPTPASERLCQGFIVERTHAGRLRFRGDPATLGDPQEAAGPAGRVPDEGRARDGAVRRQGGEPAQPRPELLAEGGAGDRAAPDPIRHRPGGGPRVHDDGLGGGGPAPRGQPRQALPAAVQRPAEGRQELPVHQDHAQRRLPAHRADAEAAERREPVLRAVCVGIERGRGDEPRAPAVPVPDVHHRHQGGHPGPRAAVPALSHQALPGPVHRGDLEGRLRARTSSRSSCSSRAARSRWSRRCATT